MNDKPPNWPSKPFLEGDFDKLHWGCLKELIMYVITCNLYAFDDCKLCAKLVLSLVHVPFETLVAS
jgi:hypothetical protein